MTGISFFSARGPLPWRKLSLLFAAAAAALALSAASRKSVTVDEFQQLPAGLAMLRSGDSRYIPSKLPPLSLVLPSLPLLAGSATLDLEKHPAGTNTWLLGRDFSVDNQASYEFLVFRGRWVPVLFLLLTLGLSWGYARSLYGEAGAFFAVAFGATCPTLLAHGTLATPDIFLASAMIGSLWAFDRYLRNPGMSSALWLGLASGLAAAVKFTGLLWIGALPLLTLACLKLARSDGGGGVASRPAGEFFRPLAVALAMAVFVLFAAYGFQEGPRPFSGLELGSGLLRGLQQLLPSGIPLPLPPSYLISLDEQLSEGGYIAYLCGQFNRVGFYSYYLVCFLVKTPAPMLLAFLLASARPARVGAREFPLVFTFAFFLIFFSLARYKNVGIRYLLFLYPLMAVWIGRLAAGGIPFLREGALRAAAAAGLLFCLAGCLLSWPDYIAYFNLPSGGGRNGHAYLLDSNLDWGQDLLALRDFMASRGIASVDLAYAGRVDPAVYGIRYATLDETASQRFVAISANLLWGRLYFVNGKDWHPSSPDFYAPFRPLEPEAVLGNSIYVYDRRRGNPSLTVRPE